MIFICFEPLHSAASCSDILYIYSARDRILISMHAFVCCNLYAKLITHTVSYYISFSLECYSCSWLEIIRKHVATRLDGVLVGQSFLYGLFMFKEVLLDIYTQHISRYIDTLQIWPTEILSEQGARRLVFGWNNDRWSCFSRL